MVWNTEYPNAFLMAFATSPSSVNSILPLSDSESVSDIVDMSDDYIKPADDDEDDLALWVPVKDSSSMITIIVSFYASNCPNTALQT